uniref:Uncharacterized protein n=1 Tax=Anguilla anguilla TaxID=7936 RepID=A0A0E9QSQ0_ANGAN
MLCSVRLCLLNFLMPHA